jgi:hypothetical protein
VNVLLAEEEETELGIKRLTYGAEPCAAIQEFYGTRRFITVGIKRLERTKYIYDVRLSWH